MATRPAPKKAARRSAARRPRRSVRLAPADRERLILQGAIDYFAEVGFEGQTRELSRRLGITQPLLYRYYPSKQALIERVYDEMFIRPWDPTWERLIADRARPLRARLIEFYTGYTRVLFQPAWSRLYMYAGLAGAELNKRYITRLEKLFIGRIAGELRAVAGLPDPSRLALCREEMELVWSMHASIFYYGVRKFIYRTPVHASSATIIAMAVDQLLAAAPLVLPSLVDAERERTGAPMRPSSRSRT